MVEIFGGSANNNNKNNNGGVSSRSSSGDILFRTMNQFDEILAGTYHNHHDGITNNNK